MQQAIPYKTWPTTTSTTARSRSPSDNNEENVINVQKLVEENAAIVFGQRGCCMCHVVERLLLGLGVNPLIFYVDQQDEASVMDEMSRIIGVEDGRPQFPAVFIGGKLFGGLEKVMATHISGELVPILKEAKALWL